MREPCFDRWTKNKVSLWATYALPRYPRRGRAGTLKPKLHMLLEKADTRLVVRVLGVKR